MKLRRQLYRCSSDNDAVSPEATAHAMDTQTHRKKHATRFLTLDDPLLSEPRLGVKKTRSSSRERDVDSGIALQR